jgi:hypothetical protein
MKGPMPDILVKWLHQKGTSMRIFDAFNHINSKSIQQQQQHSLLSQASWGRLEMKPKRDEKQGDT